MKWARCVCGGGGYVCVINIVNLVVDWPLLLHTLIDCDLFWSDDHWVCRHMSHDFDLRLTFDLDIGVNARNIVNPAVDWPPLLHTLIERDYSWSG